VAALLPRFTGEIEQSPPAHSAVWVDGRRAYKLARRGKDVQIAARPVTIHQLALVRYDYPELVLDVTCSAGTYIRSLGRDIAEALGTAAVMTALTRTQIGHFQRDMAVSPEGLDLAAILKHLRPPVEALPDLPRFVPNAAETEYMSHGRPIVIDAPGDACELAAVDADGCLLAVLYATEQGWRPRPNMIGVQ
jgi:tRNA pseudouridine55 synthase